MRFEIEQLLLKLGNSTVGCLKTPMGFLGGKTNGLVVSKNLPRDDFSCQLAMHINTVIGGELPKNQEQKPHNS